MQYSLALSLSVICLLTTNEALRVLVVFPMPTKSHSILGHGIVNRLLEAGNEVVHITGFPQEKRIPNLKEVDVSSLEKSFREDAEKSGYFELKNMIAKGNGDSMFFVYYDYIMHKQYLEHPNVVNFLSDPREKFDVVISEWFFSETTAGIAPLFQCPLIWFASTESHWQVLRLIDEIPNPAYTVELFANTKPPLTFRERTMELYKIVKKSLVLSVSSLFERYLYNTVYREIAAKRGVTLPSYSEAVYNGSLMFINSHPSIGSAFRLPQNAINIGGYHISDKVDPLPKDLQKLMDEAKHGVIYFSMGTNAKSSGMSDYMKQSLLNVFRNLTETVIWKFEAELENVPANVHLIKWAPQQSILAHQNLKFFITHGGQLSTTEALYYGVPLIGMPVGADQNINMRAVENKGYGIKVTLSEGVADKLSVAIKKILSNSSYKARAKELSFIYHDRPLSPGAELVHWVNHVAKTGGAPHLRSPALHVPLYQKLYLDLLVVIALIVKVGCAVIRKVVDMRSEKRAQNKEKSI